MNKTFTEILIQMIPVVAGILIALFINSWNEQRKDEKYMDEIFKSIHQELTESKIAIEQIIPKQKRLMDSMRHYSSNPELSIMQIAEKAGGMHAPQIRTNAWIAMSNRKIELVDFERIKVLSDIEEGKELLKQKLSYLMNFGYANMQDTATNKKQTIVILLMEIISTENSIKKQIEEYESLD